eukprot:g9880.t1
MAYRTTIEQTVFRFDDLKALLAKATPERSGDQLAGIAAQGPVERLAAQMALADLPLKAFLEEELIASDDDEVSRLVADQHDPSAFAQISSLTVGEFREWLLRPENDHDRLEAITWGLTPEMVAAVSKIMRLQDMIAVSAKRRVVTRFRNTIGLAGRLSTRNQPNHPTDDSRGIIASAIDGLLMGSGDAVIGVNPATDSTDDYIRIVSLLDELREKLAIPTQTCCLGHVTTAIRAIEKGAPVDLLFQSVAGSEKANRGFGIDLALLREAHEAGRSLGRGMPGCNVMYFETGQGAALSADAHFGVDQQTMEARAYAVAREFDPLIVNTVVGFIGPEYLFNGKQIIRAGIEDHFCGKLLGLPMGVDVCYTNHADADQEDMDTLLTLLCAAGVNFVITVPGADDIMLNYQSLSHHDAVYCRETLKRPPAPEFETWLREIGLTDREGALHEPLQVAPAEGGRQWDLRAMTDARVSLGRHGAGLPTRAQLSFLLDHAKAREAVWASVDTAALEERLSHLGFSVINATSMADSRSTYVRRPDLGRVLSAESTDRLKALASGKHYDVVIVVADGLSSSAVDLNAVPLIQELGGWLATMQLNLAPIVLATQARVALGDPIGESLSATLSVVLIGERPGLSAADSLGAYVTYNPRRGTPDSARNCVSNIRDGGLPVAAAAATIAELIRDILKARIGGVALKGALAKLPTTGASGSGS